MTTTNKAHIEAAIIEAGKFIKSAKAVLDEANKGAFKRIYRGHKTGTMRRRSMDLSQALVKLRSSEND